MENTRDLLKFDFLELQEAAKLLTARKTIFDNTKLLSDNIALEFNPSSGLVFLVDEDYNVAIMEDGILVDFHSLSGTGIEGSMIVLMEQFDNGSIIDDDDLEQFNTLKEIYGGLHGDASSISGNVSNISGNVSNISGNVDDSEITVKI